MIQTTFPEDASNPSPRVTVHLNVAEIISSGLAKKALALYLTNNY
jgi:hypothetical protein